MVRFDGDADCSVDSRILHHEIASACCRL